MNFSPLWFPKRRFSKFSKTISTCTIKNMFSLKFDRLYSKLLVRHAKSLFAYPKEINLAYSNSSIDLKKTLVNS